MKGEKPPQYHGGLELVSFPMLHCFLPSTVTFRCVHGHPDVHSARCLAPCGEVFGGDTQEQLWNSQSLGWTREVRVLNLNYVVETQRMGELGMQAQSFSGIMRLEHNPLISGLSGGGGGGCLPA